MLQWFEYIPRPNLHYRYEAMARDEAGALHPLLLCGELSYDIVSWGEAIALRGRIECHQGSYGIYRCLEGCWTGHCDGLSLEALGISELQALEWWWTGQVLDFYGVFMGGGLTICDYVFSRVEEHDGGCGPVPNRIMSWGDIKASYR